MVFCIDAWFNPKQWNIVEKAIKEFLLILRKKKYQKYYYRVVPYIGIYLLALFTVIVQKNERNFLAEMSINCDTFIIMLVDDAIINKVCI